MEPDTTKPTLANDDDSSASSSIIDLTDPAPSPTLTRTMASDAERAERIEADRDAAAMAAINEIRALEEALGSINKPTKSTKVDETSAHVDQDDKIVPADDKSTQPDDSDTDIEPETEASDTPTKPKEPEAKQEPKTRQISPLIQEITEEVQKNPEDTRVATLNTEIARIEKAKLEFIQRRQEFTKREAPIRQDIEKISAVLQSKEGELEPFNDRTAKIEDSILEIERQEKAASTPEAKHEAEKKRWQLEDKRHQIEEEKWSISRKIEEIAQSLKNKEAELDKIKTEALSTDRSIGEADDRIKELTLQIKLVELSDIKEDLEKRWVDKNNLKRSIESDLEHTRSQEAAIEEQVSQLQRNSLKTDDPTVQREYEQERHRLSLDRRDMEKKRWHLEQQLRELDQQIEKLKPEYQKALEDEKEATEALQRLRTETPAEPTN